MSSHGSGQSNRLLQEKSPYLLQHAYNPVDWQVVLHPWGEEAFKVAQETDKPIFLSVGYSTCHWCHVMERESFVNEEIAKLMNDNFVNIKVDREERPDVDRLYMAFVTSITGRGGWPMSVFLTPTGEPLTGGTYFPPENFGMGGLGFKSILKLVSDQWKTNNASVRAQGKALSDAIKKELRAKSGQAPSADNIIQGAYKHLVQGFDEQFGGFGIGPKFPKPVDLEFLLYYGKKFKDQEPAEFARMALEKTIDEINRGGIHDHLGKGFHRYAVDQQWRVPHFEKMLYDQGQLLSLYSNFYKQTGKFGDVVEDIVEYVKTNLTHKLGGFFSAEDAESYPTSGSPKKKEGAFYVWNLEEVTNLLDSDQLKIFKLYYNVSEEGNCPFEADPRGELKRQNVLYVGRRSVKELADSVNIGEQDFLDSLNKAKQILLNKQKERPRPGLDSKIITAWNGLMISGLCHAYAAFPKRKEYLEMAQKANGFLKQHLIDSDGKLLRTAYSNEGKDRVEQITNPIPAFADDYAFYIQALLDLYEVDFDEEHLRLADRLQSQMDEILYDSETKTGYYNSRAGDSTVFARMQEDQDGVEPCANSIASLNLLRLSDLIGCKDLRKQAGDIFNGHAENLAKHPFSLAKMVLSANRFAASSLQIVVISPSHEEAQPMIEEIQKRYLPDKSLILLTTDSTSESSFLLSKSEHLRELVRTPLKDDQPTVFVCENFACSLPINELGALKTRLDQI
ncbi:hypothetical protein FO519_001555 [Halicephalobus sp. NKZ332]|nr:hypothetical protein FO519_001555 [Halicephalobus sp. NKZ332]